MDKAEKEYLITQKLRTKYEEIKKEIALKDEMTQAEKDGYVLGWLDCALFVIREAR